MKVRIPYTGNFDKKSIEAFMSKISKGGYAVYSAFFGEVFAYSLDKLPTGARSLVSGKCRGVG